MRLILLLKCLLLAIANILNDLWKKKISLTHLLDVITENYLVRILQGFFKDTILIIFFQILTIKNIALAMQYLCGFGNKKKIHISYN